MTQETTARAVVQGRDEFDFRHYGWRVVLAACLGVMGGFGSLFVYTLTVFVKPLVAAFGGTAKRCHWDLRLRRSRWS
jgi:hypothetical protein